MNKDNEKLMETLLKDLAETRKILQKEFEEQRTENKRKEGNIEKILGDLEDSESISKSKYFTCFNSISNYNGPNFDEYTARFLKVVNKVRL